MPRQFNGERIIFSTNGVRTTGHPHAKEKMDLDTDITPFTETRAKWIRNLNVKCKTIKLLEDNIGEDVEHLGFCDEFLGTNDIFHEKKN